MLRIGVLVDLVGRFGRGVLEGVTTFALAHGEIDLVTPPLYGFAQLEEWDQWQVDGMVVQVANLKVVARLKQRKIPAINVSALLKETGLPTVTIDNLAVGRMAAEYLMERGFRHMAYIAFGSPAQFSIERGEAFVARLKEAQIDCEIPAARNRQELVKWLLTMPRPMGMFTPQDPTAKDILAACGQAGVSLPEHAALLGCDNDELIYRRTRPALSSIAVPAEQIGFQATKSLLALINGEKVPAREVFKPLAVITRESTDVLAVTDEGVAEALRFIRLNAHKGIRVNDVLNVVSMSRRALERRFRVALGRTLLSEILRVQLDLAQQLLSETDMQMPEIAERCGFTDATYLGLAFRKRVGVPPTMYRRQFRSRGGVGG